MRTVTERSPPRSGNIMVVDDNLHAAPHLELGVALYALRKEGVLVSSAISDIPGRKRAERQVVNPKLATGRCRADPGAASRDGRRRKGEGDAA